MGVTVPRALAGIVHAAKAWGADLVVVETPGIGQGDAAIVPHVDLPLYVMTPEFGASSQLEKIDMLDFAEIVVINKFERRGAEDALRDVRRQYARNRELFDARLEDLPVFGTVAARFNDDGVTALYQHLRVLLGEPRAACSPTACSLPATTRRVHPHRRHPAVGAAAVPGRDRRHGAPLPRPHRAAGRRGSPPAAPGRPSADDLAATGHDAGVVRRAVAPRRRRRCGRCAPPTRCCTHGRHGVAPS